MPVGFNLQKIFNEILAGEKKKILFATRNEYDALRTSLLRKYRDYNELIERLGSPNSFEGKFLKCSFSKEDVSGTFELADDARRSNKPGKVYNVDDLK
jgi:hypothetical protein